MSNSLTAQALLQARLTGRPVAIPGGQGLYAMPNGNIGPGPSGGFGGQGNALTNATIPTMTVRAPFGITGQGTLNQANPAITANQQQGPAGSPSGPAVAPASPSWWSWLTQPYSGVDLGLNAGTPVAATVPAQRPQPVLNQANPNVQTYAGQPTLDSTPIAAAPGTPSGPAMAPPGQPMPKQSQPSQSERLAAQAAAYRRATSPQGGLTTDQLNALSLAAAQQGRTYWNPAMNVQPGGNVVNALTTPPVNSMTASNYAPVMTPGQVGVGGFVAPQQPGTWQIANNQWDLAS